MFSRLCAPAQRAVGERVALRLRRRPRRRPSSPSTKVPNSTGSRPNDRTAARVRRRCAHTHGIVAVEHRDVAALLVREQARLGRAVVGRVGVAVEMIGGQVEQHADGAGGSSHPLELEARHLGHRGVPALAARHGVGRAACRGCRRRTTRRPCALQHVAEQHRGRALAVRAGDGEDRAAQQARRQLDLAPHRRCRARRRAQHRMRARHAGARHDQVDAVERLALRRRRRAARRRPASRHRAPRAGVALEHAHARAARGERRAPPPRPGARGADRPRHAGRPARSFIAASACSARPARRGSRRSRSAR